mmetsp:Transcript_78342/g.123372  ORF Transcript_78342/g.123372 Transcript_78342/m.123372 type:complete len:268 (+) Transcript_78342:140-943(+)
MMVALSSVLLVLNNQQKKKKCVAVCHANLFAIHRPTTRRNKNRLSNFPSEEGRSTLCQSEYRQHSHNCNDCQKDSCIDPSMIDVDVVAVDESHHFHLLFQGPILDCVGAKLVHDVQVHSVFQGAGVLSPPQPHRNLFGLDEETSEQQLRDKDCWCRLLRYFCVGGDATDQEGGGGGCNAGEPEDQDIHNEASLQAHEEVGGSPCNCSIQECLWQFHHGFGNEVWRSSVSLGGVFAQKDATIQGELQQQGLSCTKHSTNGHLGHSTKV